MPIRKPPLNAEIYHGVKKGLTFSLIETPEKYQEIKLNQQNIPICKPKTDPKCSYSSGARQAVKDLILDNPIFIPR